MEFGWQWHQLNHMQTICILLQRDNHTNTSSLTHSKTVTYCSCKLWKHSSENNFVLVSVVAPIRPIEMCSFWPNLYM